MKAQIDFAAHLRAWREHYGLTQRELGARVGLSVPAVCRIEKGIYSPRWQTVCRIMDGLGIGLPTFCQWPPGKPETAPV